jgi:hypothetical protein
MEDAVSALQNWKIGEEPEPKNWFRNPITGWRIDEEGNRYFHP